MNRPTANDSGAADTLADLRIMATSDLHMHLLPHDYATGLPSPHFGLAATASLIRVARAEAANSILLDNGDFLHGSAMGESLAQSHLRRRVPRRSHPLIAAMRALGYDAVTLGNHDFDMGVDYLGEVLRDAPFLTIASNLSLAGASGADGPRPLPFTRPFAILDHVVTDRARVPHTLRIGLLGMLPPGSITGLHGGPFKAEVRDIVDTAEVMVPQLRALGADLVIVLAHSGIAAEAHAPGMENAIVPLAALPGIDAIVSGHAHQVFPTPGGAWPKPVDPASGRIHGTPVVAPGFWGSHLGLIDLALQHEAGSNWHVVCTRSEARPVAGLKRQAGSAHGGVQPDRQIVRMLQPVHNAIIDSTRHPVGETRRRLHSYFATAMPAPSLDLVHRAMLWFASTRMADRLPDDLPIAASASPFKVGGLAGPGFFTDVAPGPITANALTDIYHFPNTLLALRLTGAELKDWLERAASVFNTLAPGGGDQPLIAADGPGYAFESIAGCDYEIDLSGPPRFGRPGTRKNLAASRIRNLRIGDRPLDASQDIILLTNSFRVAGGGHYPIPKAQTRVFDLSINVRDAIAEYLLSMGPYDSDPVASWRLAPVRGARATIYASPMACGAVTDATNHDIEPGAHTEAGFQAFHLAL